MLETLLFILLGVGAGIVTGLIPGIHVNLVATLVLALGVDASFAPFIVALAVTHSFLDVIPGVLLGAPESDTALGVLPGHRYLLQGNGLMAIKLTLVGSYFGLLLAILLIPLWWQVIKLYDYIVPFMGYLLLGVSGFMILRDNKRWWALLVYGLSGALGWVLLNRVVVEEPLFPLFSGLFGVATLLYSIGEGTTIPPQKDVDRIDLRIKDSIRALLAGNVSGFLTSMLPGLGSAQAAILGMNLSGKVGDHGFMVLLGSINTVNFTLSLLTWLAIDKARNGAVVAMSKLSDPSVGLVALLIAVAVIAGSIAVPLCLWLSRKVLHMLSRLPYSAVCVAVIVLITGLVAVLTGWKGLLILVTSTGLGLVPAIVKCGRAHAMGCLMFPVALYFL